MSADRVAAMAAWRSAYEVSSAAWKAYVTICVDRGECTKEGCSNPAPPDGWRKCGEHNQPEVYEEW